MGPFEGIAQSDEPLSIALDSTGVRVMKAGGRMEREAARREEEVPEGALRRQRQDQGGRGDGCRDGRAAFLYSRGRSGSVLRLRKTW